MQNKNILYLKDYSNPVIKELLFISVSNLIRKIENKEIITDRRIAVFDLDNTLLIGDIADAAMVHLVDNEIEINFKWQEYLKLVYDGKIHEAYTKTSIILEGMETSCVERLANVIFDIQDEFITFFEDDKIFKVIVPKPNPLMQELVKYLYQNNFEIFVISASNFWLVKAACQRFFQIPDENVFGVKNKTHKLEGLQILTNEIEDLAPIDTNKSKVYFSKISYTPPLLTAGDSIYDRSLLNLTHPEGIILWLGNDKNLKDVAIDFVNKQHYKINNCE